MQTTRPNHLDAIWQSTSRSDRIVLLGHDNDLLSDADRRVLARLAANANPRGGRNPSRRAGRSARRG